MSWIVGLALAAFAIYFAFFRKPKSNEIVIRVESSIPQNASEASSTESSDEEKDNWERFDFYSARMLPAKGRYRINYEDQRGLKTERDIEVKRVHESAGSTPLTHIVCFATLTDLFSASVFKRRSILIPAKS